MNSNKRRNSNLGLILATVASTMAFAAVGVVVGRWQPEIVVEAGSAPKAFPAPRVQISKLDGSTNAATVPASPLNHAPITQAVNGIAITVSNPRISGNLFAVDVCFTLPDGNPDWIISRASLQLGEAMISDWTTTPIELSFPTAKGEQQIISYDARGNPHVRIETPGVNLPGRRCDGFAFDLPPTDVRGATAKLSFHSITSSPAEGRYCAHLAGVQEQLQARGTIIEASCLESQGAVHVKVIRKPESVSLEDAEKLLLSDEWYTKFGPWTFDLNLP